MEKKKLSARLFDYFIVVLGCFLLGAGAGLCAHSGLGTDCMTVFLTGTYNRLGVTLGQMNIFLCGSQILIALGLDRKTVSVATIFGLFGVSSGIDSIGLLHLAPAAGVGAWMYLVIGTLLYAFGIAVSQLPRSGYTSFDALIYSFITHMPKVTYPQMLWAFSIFYILVGWSLGGVVGIGTVIITLVTGPLVMKYLGFMHKHSKRYPD